jgi:hypothetical protein
MFLTPSKQFPLLKLDARYMFIFPKGYEPLHFSIRAYPNIVPSKNAIPQDAPNNAVSSDKLGVMLNSGALAEYVLVNFVLLWFR